jgi:protein-disulfide isomerase
LIKEGVPVKLSYLKLISFLSGLLFFAPVAFADQPGFNPDQTLEIQSIVRDYLVKNPQVIIEAVRSLQQQEVGQARKLVLSHATELFHSSESPVLGNPKGNIVMVEFQDYQCTYCKKMEGPIAQLIKDEPNLRLIVKELPIFGPASQYAAQAALASQKQGRYQALHTALEQMSSPLSEAIILDAAKKAGIDTNRLKNDMTNKSITQELETNLTLANQLGIRGTPSYLLASNIDSPSRMKVVFIPGVASESTLKDVIKQLRTQ